MSYSKTKMTSALAWPQSQAFSLLTLTYLSFWSGF